MAVGDVELFSGPGYRIARGQLEVQEAIVPAADTTTNRIDGRGASGFGLVVPAALTSTTITFTVSARGTTFQALYDTTNTQVSMTVATSRSYDLPTSLFSWSFFKIVCGTTEGVARTFLITMKG